MDEVVDVLLHPARWAADASTFRPLTRLYLALVLFALTLLFAVAAGAVSSRWARRRARGAGRSERGERTITRVRRGFVALSLLVGAYLASEMAPLPPRVEGWVAGTLYVVAAAVAARLTMNVVALLLTTSIKRANEHERARLELEYVPLAEKVTALAAFLVAAIVVAKHFGKDVTSLVTALGVGSLAIGLAAQQTLGNMIAGVVILADRPFRPGDRVKLATGEVGEVRDIGVRSTRIRMLDGNTLVVPNAELANSRVVNYAVLTQHSDVKLTVAVDSDVEKVAALLKEVAAEDARARNLAVRVTNVSPHGIELSVAFDTANAAEALATETELRRRAVTRLRAEKVGLPDAYKSSQGVPSGSPV